jgi:hypothetical protein
MSIVLNLQSLPLNDDPYNEPSISCTSCDSSSCN